MTITYTCVIKKMWRYIFIVVNERKNGNGGKNADFINSATKYCRQDIAS